MNEVKDKFEKPVNLKDFSTQASDNGHEKTLHEIFRSTILDQLLNYQDPEYVLTLKYNEAVYNLLSKKSISLKQGKQKTKKTLFYVLMIAAFIRHTIGIDDIDFIGSNDGIVLWFDCEQGESYAARTMKLILKLAGLDKSDRLIFCNLREFPPKQRMNIIREALESTKGVSLVIIDGIVDLMEDFMDAAEGHFLVTQLLTWASIYNVHISGVLHQNKADTNARAHVGSILSQKCELEFMAKVDPDDKARSIIECVNARGLPFDPFAIRWDKGQLPRIDQEWQAGTGKKEIKSVKEYETTKVIAKGIFKPLKSLSFTESTEQIMNVTKKSEATAIRYLKQWVVWGLIEKGADGNYRIKL